MKIVFFGYGQLGANVLRGVAARREIVLVVTHPLDFTGIAEPDVAEAATELGLPIALSTVAAEPELHERLRSLRPDVMVATNWRTRVPVEVLDLPRLGCVNVHDALLPAYAGLGAVNWAIRNGEYTTGLTAHLMAAEFDTGPVLARTVVKIGPTDTAKIVLDQLLEQYVPVTLEALARLGRGHRGEPQRPLGASFYHRIGEQDTRIDWRESATTVHNLIRGQSDPFLNAWTTHDGQRLWVKAADRPSRTYGGTPGRVVRVEHSGVAVACGRPVDGEDRGILLLQVATDSGPPVRAVDYFCRAGGYLR